MKIYRIRNLDEYLKHTELMQADYSARQAHERSLIPKWRNKFKVKGYSYPAGAMATLHVDYLYQSKEGLPNWRERLVCPVTKLNNRMRASVHIFDIECSPYQQDRIYITEQVTSLYNHFSTRFNNVTGSEFVGEDIESGHVTSAGIRHEDLTQLSFQDEYFKNVLTFDCLEHIPNYKKALAECYRIITPGGNLLISAPFDLNSHPNIIRARLNSHGQIEHTMEPEYHGDPMKKGGCLCYQYFGWEMLEDIKDSGFNDAYVLLYWSKEYAYLGGEQIFFVAKK